MASALLEQVAVDIADASGRLRLRANGSVVAFDGFLALYQEDRDDAAADDEGEGTRLPAMRKAERLARDEVVAEPAFHPAAAALYRGEPGQEARRARHRPAFDLRLDHPGAAGPRLCPARQEALRARRPRPAGHRFPDRAFSSATSSTISPPISRTSSTTSPAAGSTGRRCCDDFWQDFSTAVDGTKELTITQVLDCARRRARAAFLPE